MTEEAEKFLSLATACRKQAQITTNPEAAAALDQMADNYEAEAMSLLAELNTL